MRRLLFLFLLVFLLFNNMSNINSHAQTCSDPDGDGLCSEAGDNCPNVFGPRTNNGCPVDTDRDDDGVSNSDDRCPDQAGITANNGCPAPDADGDGTPDSQDRCPDVSGPSWNGGCPEDGNGSGGTGGDPCSSITAAPNCNPNPNDNNDSTRLPDLPDTGRCVLGTRYSDRVNVRIRPSTIADVVGQLEPNVIVAVIDVMDTPEGRWYRINQPQGWVFGEVVRVGGECANPVPPSSDEPTVVECRSLQLLSPIDVNVAGQALLKWTSPSAEVPVAFYQISIFDMDGNWLHDEWTFEPATEVLIDLVSLGLGPNTSFKWQVTALDESEYPLCSSVEMIEEIPNYEPETGQLPVCDAELVLLSPVDTTVTGLTEFSWDIPQFLNGSEIFFVQLNIFNADGVSVYEMWVSEHSWTVDLSTLDFGGKPDFTWQLIAFDEVEAPVCVSGAASADTVPSETPSTEPETGQLPACDAELVLLSPVGTTVTGLTEFSWDMPESQYGAQIFFVQLNIFNADGESIYEMWVSEESWIVDLTNLNFAGKADFTWQLIAFDGVEEAVCASAAASATTVPNDNAVRCPSLQLINPVNETVAGQTLFSWVSASSDVEVAFYQISLYDDEGNWLYDAWALEPSTEVLIDLSEAGVGANFQWRVIALDWDENPICASGLASASTGLNPNAGSPNPMCADFVGLAPMSELGTFSSDFSWTTIADVPYYHLMLFNSDMVMVADAWTISAGATSGFSLITSADAIGAGEDWFWQVEGHWSNMGIACVTALYPISRAAETGMTPSQPNPEGMCDAFVLLSPETETSVPEYLDVVELNWSPVAQPVLMAYMVYAGPVGGPMELQVTTPNTTATLDLTKFEGLSDIQWQVKAVSASALTGAGCESEIFYINLGESENAGGGNEGGGLIFPNIDLSIFTDWACPSVQVLIFSDSVESSYFMWNAIPGAAGYRMNFYAADDSLAASIDMESFVEALVTQVPFGPKDEWSFELQLLMPNQVIICTSQRYHVERDFEVTGDIILTPITFEFTECAEFEAISPLDTLGNGLYTYFEWTNLENAIHYDIKIYDANDNVVFWGGSVPDDGEAIQKRALYTDVAHIGAGTNFSWEVTVELDGDITCATGRIPVTRPGNPFGFIPDLDISLVDLELKECANFAPVAPLDFLGDGLFTYFQWTSVPEAEHYDLKIYNEDDVLVHWGYVPADPYGNVEEAAYYTDAAHIGAGINFSWEVIATLENGLACTSPRQQVARHIARPNLPVIFWDLSGVGDMPFIDPDDAGRGDACRNNPTAFLGDFCNQQNGGGDGAGRDGGEVSDVPTSTEGGGAGEDGGESSDVPTSTEGGGGGRACGAVANFGDGSVRVLRHVVGDLPANLNFCNPTGHGLLLPAVHEENVMLFFFDAEDLGYDEAGKVGLIIVLAPNPEQEGGVIIIGHAQFFVPEGSELTPQQIMKIVNDGLADPPGELTDGTLGYLIGLLHDAGLEAITDGTLNFEKLPVLLLNVGGLNPSFINLISSEMMQGL